MSQTIVKEIKPVQAKTEPTPIISITRCIEIAPQSSGFAGWGPRFN